MSELHQAFDKLPFVDIVLYDACLMQDIEVVTELVDDVAYVIASQSERWGKSLGSNIYMDKALQWLMANPNASAKQLALQIFKHDMHDKGSGDCSVVGVSRISKLNDEIDKFATAAINYGSLDPTQWTHLKTARQSATNFPPGKPILTFGDIWML